MTSPRFGCSDGFSLAGRMSDRRARRRMRVPRTVQVVRNGEAAHARCRDFSDTGMKLDLTAPLYPNDVVTVALSPSIILCGTVAWVRGSECGVVFDGPVDSAALLDDDYDVFVVHDPQPAAIRHFTGARGAKWVWRCHIDTSAPSESASRFLRPFIAEYDAVIFTMAEFLLPELQAKRMAFIAPAIDPLATKNMDLPRDLCRQAMADAGLDLSRPVPLLPGKDEVVDPDRDGAGLDQQCRWSGRYLDRNQYPG